MKLSLVSIDKSGFIRVAAEGELTSRDVIAGDGKNPMEVALGDNWATNKVSLDLSKTRFIDSSAIGWLINCQKKFKAGGGKMAIHSASPRVRDVFDLLRMRSVLNVVDTEDDARKILTDGQAV